MPSPDPAHRLALACRRVAENSLYTGQTHFAMAEQKAKRTKLWLMLLPSVVSAASGLAVALGAPAWVGAFAAFAGAVSAIASFLGVDKEANAHEVAGKLLTQLRHEAHALCETYSPDMSVAQFEAQVRALEQRYGAFVASLPLTDDTVFEKVRTRIQSGTFKYDSEAEPTPASPAPKALPAPATPLSVATTAGEPAPAKKKSKPKS